MSITEEESACSFSRGGEFFAASTAESEVKVWDRGTGSLHQSLVCTKLQAKVQCLVWGREKVCSVDEFAYFMNVSNSFPLLESEKASFCAESVLSLVGWRYRVTCGCVECH